MIINNKIYLLLIIMILVKNKLKKIKNIIDDDEMLNLSEVFAFRTHKRR